MATVVIAGAGPAGLSAAYHLGDHHDVLVLEKETEPGGLCRSFDLGGTTFDLGGHAFFTRHDYVRALVGKLCRGGVHTQPRKAWVHAYGTYVPYPFQSHLHGLPGEVVEDCLVGLYEAASQPATGPVVHLADWIRRRFGPGIGRHFLEPYNRKIWAYPLEDISPDWVSERVVLPDVRAIVAGALRPVAFTDFANATVRYPSEGGFANLYAGFVDGLARDVVHDTVTRVDLGRRRLETASGDRVDYDHLISTMPLDQLVLDVVADPPAGCREAAATLRHNAEYLVNLVFDRPRITDMQRVYCADPAVPFHKLVVNSNSSEDLRSRPVTGMQAEVSHSPHKAVERDGLEERVHRALLAMGIVTEDDAVVASSVVDLPYAYPVYTRQTRAARAHLLGALSGAGVSCAGRFGEWLYINSDDAVMRGKARADELGEGR